MYLLVEGVPTGLLIITLRIFKNYTHTKIMGYLPFKTFRTAYKNYLSFTKSKFSGKIFKIVLTCLNQLVQNTKIRNNVRLVVIDDLWSNGQWRYLKCNNIKMCNSILLYRFIREKMYFELSSNFIQSESYILKRLTLVSCKSSIVSYISANHIHRNLIIETYVYIFNSMKELKKIILLIYYNLFSIKIDSTVQWLDLVKILYIFASIKLGYCNITHYEIMKILKVFNRKDELKNVIHLLENEKILSRSSKFLFLFKYCIKFTYLCRSLYFHLFKFLKDDADI